MAWLFLAAAFFLGIHVFVSGTRLRGAIVGRIGERAFQAMFSLLSLGGIVWLARAYARVEGVPLWHPAGGVRWVALILMAIAFLFVVIGLTTPSPTAAGGESLLDRNQPAKGVLRVTRHPFLWGVAVWAATHLALNGDTASAVFFGALLLLALIGPLLIDAKRHHAFGAKWERFAAITSNVPFLAILAGRNTLHLGEIGAWRIALALLLYGVFLYLHPWLFGTSALPL